MKHLIILIILIIITIFNTGCIGESIETNTSLYDSDSIQSSLTTEDIKSTALITDKIEPTEKILESLKPLELIGYFIDDNGDIFIPYETFDGFDWKTADIVTYRKYFFGTWEYKNYNDEIEHLIIDNSENNNCWGWLTSGFFQKENVIYFHTINNAEVDLYWIDIDNPDIMYYISLYAFDSGLGIYYNFDKNIDYKINFLTKTDFPINKPENNYLGNLAIYELALKHEIDSDLIFKIEYESDGKTFYKDDRFITTPTYLIVDESERIVIKTSVSLIEFDYENQNIDIIIYLKKHTDEWLREINIDL